MRPTIALEIGPLAESYYTGIANVARSLAAAMIEDASVDKQFFVGRQEIPEDFVRTLLDGGGGALLNWFIGRANYRSENQYETSSKTVAIFTQHKFNRRFFMHEALIVHDLTAVITPQFHSAETVAFENARFLGDAASSDLLVAVSESTRLDIRNYYPELRHIPCVVAPLAPCVNADARAFGAGRTEPYVLVLGTLEPRKSIEFLLACLSMNRSLLDAASFVFVGRWGWGQETQAMIARYGLQDMIASRRMRFTGYLADYTKDILVANAKCVVYASRYEGFGLPILEACKCGVPIITGHGSSLPEVGGDAAYYCDITDPVALNTALTAILPQQADAASLKRWADTFSWTKTYRTIRDAAIELL